MAMSEVIFGGVIMPLEVARTCEAAGVGADDVAEEAHRGRARAAEGAGGQPRRLTMTSEYDIENHIASYGQIEALRAAAAAAGDLAQVELCTRALARDSEAWLECEALLSHSAAQADD
jgi:hypothetical protein